MKKIMIAALAAAPVVIASASANETEEFCVAFASGNGWDTEPCACVGEVGEADPDVKEAILALSDADDVDAMDPSVREALAVCFPDNG